MANTIDFDVPAKRRKCRPWLTRTTAEKTSDMRRTWIELDNKAKAARSYIGRCTSDTANAWWQRRAARWQHFADWQHAALKAEIGLTGHEPRITSADMPPLINWQTYPTNPTEAEYDTDEMEPLTL